jgi:hypothetical protein
MGPDRSVGLLHPDDVAAQTDLHTDRAAGLAAVRGVERIEPVAERVERRQVVVARQRQHQSGHQRVRAQQRMVLRARRGVREVLAAWGAVQLQLRRRQHQRALHRIGIPVDGSRAALEPSEPHRKLE